MAAPGQTPEVLGSKAVTCGLRTQEGGSNGSDWLCGALPCACSLPPVHPLLLTKHLFLGAQGPVQGRVVGRRESEQLRKEADMPNLGV